MSFSAFQALCSGVCDLAGVPVPDLACDASGIFSFAIHVEGVEFVISQQRALPAAVILMCAIGPPPPGGELAAFRSLLDANFLLAGHGSPVFSRDPESGEVLVHRTMLIDDCAPHLLHAGAAAAAQLAQRWRQGFFHDEETNAAGAAMNAISRGLA